MSIQKKQQLHNHRMAADKQCSTQGKSWLSCQALCWLPACPRLVKLTQLELQVLSRLGKARKIETTVTRPGAR